MTHVTRVVIPVNPAPKEYVYVIELGEDQAYFLREILLPFHSGSLTATQIIEGLNKVGLK